MSVVLVREIYSPKASRVDSICIGKGRRQVRGYSKSSGAGSWTLFFEVWLKRIYPLCTLLARVSTGQYFRIKKVALSTARVARNIVIAPPVPDFESPASRSSNPQTKPGPSSFTEHVRIASGTAARCCEVWSGLSCPK